MKSVIFTNTQWKVINDIIITKYFERSIIKLKYFANRFLLFGVREFDLLNRKFISSTTARRTRGFSEFFPSLLESPWGHMKWWESIWTSNRKVEGSTPEKKSDFSEGYSAFLYANYWLWNNIQLQLLMANLWFSKNPRKGTKHKIDVVGQKLHR